jgi:hypothetical protein
MKGKKEYKVLVRLDPKLKKPLQDKATENDRSVNSEINVALKNHVTSDKDKLK